MPDHGASAHVPAVPSPIGTSLEWSLAALGCAAALAAALIDPHHTAAAAAQVWPPFVLVAGLLLVGLVAHEDGLFAWAGTALGRLARNGWVLYCGAAVLVVVVTTVLNLDTAVTFLTPVVIYAARGSDDLEAPLVYACLLLANAGSLLLPGSNLTNLIVLGHLHLSGARFLAHMPRPPTRPRRSPRSSWACSTVGTCERSPNPGRQLVRPCSERGWRRWRR